MTDTWDGRPENPERDGWHWLQYQQHAPEVMWWDVGMWWDIEDRYRPPEEIAKLYIYIGPCLTPAEVAAREAAAYRCGVAKPRGVCVEKELSDAAIDAVRKQLGKYSHVPHVDNAVRSAICYAYQRGQEDMRERAAIQSSIHCGPGESGRQTFEIIEKIIRALPIQEAPHE